MSIQSIQGVLEQINFQAQQVSAPQKRSSFVLNSDNYVEKPQFPTMLFNSISKAQNVAKNQAQDYMTGATDIGLNDVMVSLQKSSVALNLGIQVRNKMVSAYQEIMNMAV